MKKEDVDEEPTSAVDYCRSEQVGESVERQLKGAIGSTERSWWRTSKDKEKALVEEVRARGGTRRGGS